VHAVSQQEVPQLDDLVESGWMREQEMRSVAALTQGSETAVRVVTDGGVHAQRVRTAVDQAIVGQHEPYKRGAGHLHSQGKAYSSALRFLLRR
jgi:hypothetical protein